MNRFNNKLRSGKHRTRLYLINWQGIAKQQMINNDAEHDIGVTVIE